ncbi:MAG: hypothetical protein U0520_01460 [Candidatus Saccharimonadales bacterium]
MSRVLGTLPLPKNGCELPFMQKPSVLLDTAFSLYGFLPTDDDPRWPFLARYEEVKRRTGFRPINFENAFGAVYLSADTSFRSGHVTTINPENSLQLDRALDNLDAQEYLVEMYGDEKCDDGIDIQFVLTDRIAAHQHDRPQFETPCPEALYQARLYHHGQYLARLGLNVHRERESKVLSIVNIQGIPDGREKIEKFRDAYGVSPFNLLVQRVVRLSSTGDTAPVIRGLINPARGNSRLYWGVLGGEGIERYRVVRKPSLKTVEDNPLADD